MVSRELFGAAAAAAGAITGAAAAEDITTENADPMAQRSEPEHHEARILSTFILSWPDGEIGVRRDCAIGPIDVCVE